ncbi:hypothetical protein [Azovibrio restrictus]|uniref:hypothetical protein n=1 Tax=Azovibrio restrictus TaxID=146938 RepID=UPI0012EC9369|nr:hypothetical protein [Azovibrio restrictus]
MAKTRRDRDFFKLRKLAKKMTEMLPQISNAAEISIINSAMTAPEYAALDAKFNGLWSKYGKKSMVMDRRRRVSTRHANQQGQLAEGRAKKRSEKQKALMSIKAELNEK